MRFFIVGGGDSSVGIWATEEVVTFEGNIELDGAAISQIKTFLKELDDNGAEVYTEEEYDKSILGCDSAKEKDEAKNGG